MTAPVLTQNNYMQFILPQKYERVDQVPTPTNPSVIIKEAPQRIVAVYKFSGACTREQCTKKLKKLHKMLVADQLLEGPAAASLAAQPPAGGFSASSAADTAAAASAQAEFTGKMEQPASEPPAQAEELSATAGAKGPAQEEPAQQKEKAEKGEREEDLSGFVADALSWLVAQYHPPWTLPFLRRNEVWIELDPQIPAVVTLLQQYQQYQQAQQEQDAEGQVESGMKGGAAEVGAGAEAVGGDVLQSGSSGAAQEEGTSAAAGGAGMQYTPSLGTQQPIVESSGKYQQQQNVGFTTPPAGPETDSD